MVALISTFGFALSATININPAQNTWQATYSVPGTAARSWNFSSAGVEVIDLSAGGIPFPNNTIALSLTDPIANAAIDTLPLPTSESANGFNGTFVASGALPPGGHFTIGNGVLPQLSNFGGFRSMPFSPAGYPGIFAHGTNALTLQLYVDNLLVSSKSVSFAVD